MDRCDGVHNTICRIATKSDRGWSGQLPSISYRVALAFVAPKKEDVVSDNRSAHGAAELFQVAWILRCTDRIEEVACVQGGVAAEGVGGAVERVGPRLQPDIDDRSRLPTVFRARILLEVELLDGVDGQDRR